MKVEVNGHIFDTDSVNIVFNDKNEIVINDDYTEVYMIGGFDSVLVPTSDLFNRIIDD